MTKMQTVYVCTTDFYATEVTSVVEVQAYQEKGKWYLEGAEKLHEKLRFKLDLHVVYPTAEAAAESHREYKQRERQRKVKELERIDAELAAGIVMPDGSIFR